MGGIFPNNVNAYSGVLRHSRPGLEDVTSVSCVRCTVPVKVIRRNGRLFDWRRSHHIDMPAQSKRDQARENRRKAFRILPSVKPTNCSPTTVGHLHKTGDTGLDTAG